MNIKSSLSEGLESFLENNYDVILLDLTLPDSSGINTISILKEKIKNIPIIVLTGRDDEKLALESLKLGVQDYLVKGKLSSTLLERSICYALERHQVVERLKSSERKVLEALHLVNFYKDMFIHDINNIFQGILSATDLCSLQLKNSEKCQNVLDILKIIEDQIFRGSKLISNVRKISLLENSDITTYPIDVQVMLKRTIVDLKQNFPNRKIDIQIDYSNSDFIVLANELIQDVFDNLLINSVIHNENPIVIISIHLTKEQINKINYIKFEFIDNGVGIEDSRKNTILSRGGREDKFKSGLGLGLTLVYKIVASYNGRIWVEDKFKGDYTKGSNFVILIPEVV